MRWRLSGFVLAVVCAAAPLAGAGAAQPQQIQTVADRLGRFTVRFPISWEVRSVTIQPRRPSPALVSNEAVSVVTGAAPHRAGEHWPTQLSVIAGILKRPMTPSEMANEVRLGPGPDGEPPSAARLLEEGNTGLAGRPAYYRYLATHDDDTNTDLVHLFGFLPVQRVGYVVFGTIKQLRLKRDTPVVLQIVESLRPAAPARGYPFPDFTRPEVISPGALPGQASATASISTAASRGSLTTWTVDRAGGFSWKYSP